MNDGTSAEGIYGACSLGNKIRSGPSETQFPISSQDQTECTWWWMKVSLRSVESLELTDWKGRRYFPDLHKAHRATACRETALPNSQAVLPALDPSPNHAAGLWATGKCGKSLCSRKVSEHPFPSCGDGICLFYAQRQLWLGE